MKPWILIFFKQQDIPEPTANVTGYKTEELAKESMEEIMNNVTDSFADKDIPYEIIPVGERFYVLEGANGDIYSFKIQELDVVDELSSKATQHAKGEI